MMRQLAYALPATLSFALMACGGGPDLNQIKNDFQNPSGSVQNKDGMVASSGALGASGPAVVVAGGGVPGASLTASGKGTGLQQINLRRNWEGRAQSLANVLAGRSSQQALTEAQVSGLGCEQSAEAQAAFEEAAEDVIRDAANPFTGSKITGKASYSVDLGTCSNGELSGRASIDLKIVFEAKDNEIARFAFTVNYALENVCELTTDAKACLDGTLVLEAEAIGEENFGRLTTTTGWDLSGTWKDEGVDRAGSLKGGIRTLFEGNDATGTAKIEVLNYVNSPEGEWSYVWSFEGSFNGVEGTAMFECRGRDGSVSCTINDAGGMCSASDGSTLTWTAADESSVSEDWFDD